MPTHTNPPDARQLQAPPVELEAVAVLLEAERTPAVEPAKARIPRLLARTHAPEEGLEGLVQILHYALQDVAMHALRPRIGGLALLDPAQLREGADGALFLLPGLFALCKAVVIEATA